MARLEGCLDSSARNSMKQEWVGLSSTDTIGFYGATPVAQRSAAILTATGSLFATTGASFVAQTSTTVSGIFGFSSVLASNLFDALIEIRAWMVALGLHKGGA